MMILTKSSLTTLYLKSVTVLPTPIITSTIMYTIFVLNPSKSLTNRNMCLVVSGESVSTILGHGHFPTYRLSQWLPDRVSPELLYLEAKWASLMSYGLTAERLKDVLSIGDTLNAVTIRNHTTKVADRQNAELEGKANS